MKPSESPFTASEGYGVDIVLIIVGRGPPTLRLQHIGLTRLIEGI